MVFLRAGSTWQHSLATCWCKFWFCNLARVGLSGSTVWPGLNFSGCRREIEALLNILWTICSWRNTKDDRFKRRKRETSTPRFSASLYETAWWANHVSIPDTSLWAWWWWRWSRPWTRPAVSSSSHRVPYACYRAEKWCHPIRKPAPSRPLPEKRNENSINVCPRARDCIRWDPRKPDKGDLINWPPSFTYQAPETTVHLTQTNLCWWSGSNSPCSLTRNITSHTRIKNFAFHSLLRWKMIIPSIIITSLICFSLKGWKNVLCQLGSERVNEGLLLIKAMSWEEIASCRHCVASSSNNIAWNRWTVATWLYASEDRQARQKACTTVSSPMQYMVITPDGTKQRLSSRSTKKDLQLTFLRYSAMAERFGFMSFIFSSKTEISYWREKQTRVTSPGTAFPTQWKQSWVWVYYVVF